MPSISLTYRLRIVDAANAAILTVTSQRGGTNPFIAEPPRGDGLEVDPIRGTVRTGSYSVLVSDPITTGTTRLVTGVLADGGGRQQLLSRRAFVEISTDGGTNWTVEQAGYVLGVRLVDAITYEITVGDTRRIEQQRVVFEFDDPTYFKVRGAVLGGPLTGGSFGPIADRGGLLYRVTAVTATGNGGNRVNATFVSGYSNGGQSTTRWQDIVNPFGVSTGTDSEIDTWAAAYYNPLTSTVIGGGALGTFERAFPGLVYRVSPFLNPASKRDFLPLETRPGAIGGDVITLLWDNTGVPSVGTLIRVALLTERVSADCPLYVSDHPVDIVRNLYLQAAIPINAASFDTLRALVGADVRVSLRITEPSTLSKFIESALAGPFGIGLRVNSAGEIVAFSTRIKTTTTPTVTINTDTLTDQGQVFELDEATVISKVVLTAQRLAQFIAADYPAGQGRTNIAPPRDGILVSSETIEVANADVAAFGERDVSYTVPGMIHTAAAFTSTAQPVATALAGEIFDRYGRGVQSATLPCLRGAGLDSVNVGDEVYVQPAHIPNANKRYGDDTAVGARIMQVVRRTDTPDGPELKVLDSGLAAQPATAPTITIAASGQHPTQVATFTVTNAATLNSGGLAVAIEWAVSPTTPTTAGADFARYVAPDIPTGTVELPAVTPGSTVWVRARSELAGRRPSAWTAWTDVTLTALPSPSGLTASDIKRNAVTLTWTNGSVDYSVRVQVAPTAAADTADAVWIAADLPAGSTSTVVRGLDGPSVAYTARVAHITREGYAGSAATTTFTTSSTSDAALRPAGIAVLPTTGPAADAGLPVGVAVAAWAADPAYLLVLERAPDSGGSPGTYAEVAVVPGTTEVYVDPLPADGATRWYRWRHRLPGYADSAATCGRSAAPGGVPPGVQRPPLVVPAVRAEVSEAGTTGTVTLDITDPQCRVVDVRFRYRVQPAAWSAYTTLTSAPWTFSETIPSSGFLEIEWEVRGYDGSGALVVLATSIEFFDADAGAPVANITSIGITFDTNGTPTLTILADSDTQSIKWAWNTNAPPNLATVQAASATNSRNIVTTLLSLQIGDTAYVSAVGYTGLNGTGSEGPLSTSQSTRDGAPPEITTITVTYSQTGEAFLIVTADARTGSVKYAVSTTAAPDQATVQAASATNGRQVVATLTGPYNVNDTLYVSALAYRNTGGLGQEGPLTSIAFTRQGDDLRVVEMLSETATLGTLDLTVYDPTLKVSSVRARTMAGHAAWSSYSTLTNTGTGAQRQHQSTVSLVEKVPSKIEYQVLGTDLTGGVSQVLATNIITFAMGSKPFPPTIFATVREDGKVDVAVVGDSDTASVQIGFSTASQAAADAALGSTVNARQTVFLNIGTLTLGQRAFVAARAYSGSSATGEASEIARAEVIYSNVNTTKAIRIPFTAFRKVAGTEPMGYDGYAYGDTTIPDDLVAAAADFELSPGSTITSMSGYTYDDGTATTGLTVQLFRLTDAGSFSSLGTLPNPRIGWNTASVSVSDTVSTNSYTVLVFFRPDTDERSQRVSSIGINYTSPTLLATT